jgi:Kef-type K+ transport system membrane component KefB
MSFILYPLGFFWFSGSNNLLFELLIIFAAAKVAAEICERLRQPAVVGEILTGVLLGPSVLSIITKNETNGALAEMGVILLLFTVGLEVNASELLKVGKQALLVAVLGVIIPFLAGFLLMVSWGATFTQEVFIGAALVATSVGITARVLASMNKLSTKASQIILAAAVIDDILGLLILSVVSSLARGQLNYLELSVTTFLSIGFMLFMLLVGTKLAQRLLPQVNRLRISQALFVVALTLCFGLSWLATIAGVAGIIGAFLAGIALGESTEKTDLHHQISAIMEFLLPFFFVGIGLQLDLSVFRDQNVIFLAVIVTILAIVTKILGCGLPTLPAGRKLAMQVGCGMVPRGEVGIIVAQLGLSIGVLTAQLYGVVVFMAVVTTLVAPPLLTLVFAGEQSIRTPDEAEIIEPTQPLSDLE